MRTDPGRSAVSVAANGVRVADKIATPRGPGRTRPPPAVRRSARSSRR
jgi:hypothetical protein